MSRRLRLPSAAIGAFEIIVNRILASDERALARCGQLAGATLAVHVTDLSLALRVTAVTHGLQIQRWGGDEPFDVSLSGPASAFIKVARASDNSAISGSGLRFEGDIGMAQGFAGLFAGIELDPADWVDRRFGPLPASLVERVMRTAVRLGRLLSRELPDQLGDYLIEETGDIVRRDEGEQFAGSVTTLRDDVERLSARLDRLGPAAN